MGVIDKKTLGIISELMQVDKGIFIHGIAGESK